MPGDFGFDPLGLGTQGAERLKWCGSSQHIQLMYTIDMSGLSWERHAGFWFLHGDDSRGGAMPRAWTRWLRTLGVFATLNS